MSVQILKISKQCCQNQRRLDSPDAGGAIQTCTCSESVDPVQCEGDGFYLSTVSIFNMAMQNGNPDLVGLIRENQAKEKGPESDTEKSYTADTEGTAQLEANDK